MNTDNVLHKLIVQNVFAYTYNVMCLYNILCIYIYIIYIYIYIYIYIIYIYSPANAAEQQDYYNQDDGEPMQLLLVPQ